MNRFDAERSLKNYPNKSRVNTTNVSLTLEFTLFLFDLN